MQTVKVDRLNLETDDWVLDVGCGEGRHMHAAYWNNFVNVVGVDLDREVLETTREGFKDVGNEHAGHWSVQRADALRLPFPDNTFDTVICSEVLEHLPDYETAIDELQRVMKPEGTAAVSVPRYGPEKICWMLSDEYHQVEGGHVRIFTQNQVKDSLKSAGFTLESTHYEHAAHSPFWWLKCLLWESKDSSFLVSTYNQILESGMLHYPTLLNWVESLLNPIMGKSYVLYFKGDPN
ncbi:MAG: class I SAM-dependent methyltransferase [bacterium]